MIFIENKHLKVSFTNKGAELQAVINKDTGLNYMWSGNPGYWAKFSPVLFPIVGALKDSTYYFEDKAYKLSRHGFARDLEFGVNQLSDTEVIFTLTHNKETLKIYPFQFILSLKYTLTGTSLACTYQVENPSTDYPLYFSLGAHPAFAVPLKGDLTYKDYFLEFDDDNILISYKVSGDLIQKETIEHKLIDGRLALNHDLFYDDALVFKTLNSKQISIRSDKDIHGLNFSFKDFPFFGIWAAKDADFICLEPWCGIADGIEHQQDLTKKEGIIHLSPSQIWRRKWEISCF